MPLFFVYNTKGHLFISNSPLFGLLKIIFSSFYSKIVLNDFLKFSKLFKWKLT